MIRQRADRTWVAYCDGECGASVVTGLKSFRQAANYISRSEGWDNRKRGDDWFNYCPSCAEYAQPERENPGIYFGRKVIPDDD